MSWLISLIIDKVLSKLGSWLALFFAKEVAEKRQESADKANEEELKKAIESGDKDAIAKAGEDLLNGRGVK